MSESKQEDRRVELPERIEAVTFDCYGTLVDWERGILDAIRPVIDKPLASDDEVLRAYAKLESEIEAGSYRRYREVLAAVEEGLVRHFGVAMSGDGRLADSLTGWPAFPDTVEAIRGLRGLCRVGIISNIDDDLIAAHLQRLGMEVDFVVTAQSCGSYKPALRNFGEAKRRHGLGEGWVHAAESLYHDVRPCNELGIPCVWVHRRHEKAGFGATAEAEARPAMRVRSVVELMDIVRGRVSA